LLLNKVFVPRNVPAAEDAIPTPAPNKFAI